MPDKEIRLQVYLAKSGIASRRASEKLILDGRVSVNGVKVTELGTKVLPSDIVCFDNQQIKFEKEKRYVLLNKPVGYVCSLSDEMGRATAADLLKEAYTERLYNIGRLDMYSGGAILFTNDGDFSARIEHPSAEIEKEYLIETTQDIPDTLIERFTRGIRIEGIFYRCVSAKRQASRKASIVLIEGKNREIRKVLDFFKIPIKRLIRVRIGGIQLNGLKPGEFRNLTKEEIAELLHNNEA
ncbi:rRNA pseudouridine synthase [Treponema phagedenis]|uniref:Pseudouridine synthase n=1 Tax=Treponema phagedenis TaxID=162 RepID=A0A0B7GYW1_TREPH|nr:pseudouridine synthase [Treponema phagedenis]QSH99202.1 rRNA pseudouridine synthase [Treponema phagedenis]CEM62135.1 Pseudouridine synthase [Treponema phagedenis]